MLPNGYEYADMVYRRVVGSSSPYFDLGIVSSSDIDISILFDCEGQQTSDVFGARNSNSNSSAGQLNLYYGGYEAASYLGYASARTNIGTSPFQDLTVSLQKESNEFTINCGNRNLIEVTGATTVFTGSRNMFLFALNNAGTPRFGNVGYMSFACVRVFSNGSLTHEFLPVYDYVNNEQCLYDSVTDTIIQKSGSGDWVTSGTTHSLLTLESDVGGYAYIQTKTEMEVTKLYCNTEDAFDVGEPDYYKLWYRTKVVAYENNGYTFLGWEKDGQIVSTEREELVAISEDTVLRARFVKNAEGQKNKSYLMCFNYGTVASQSNIENAITYVPVVRADIKVDGVDKTTSTIEVENVPSTVLVNSIVVLKNPKGKTMYIGIIETIAETTLTCREALGLFDADYLFGVTRNSNVTLMKSLSDYMISFENGYPSYRNASAEINASIIRKMLNVGTTYSSTDVSLDKNLNMNITAPVISEIEVKNLEDHLLEAFDNFGIYIEPRLIAEEYALLRFYVRNPKVQKPLVISNNSEAITNVSIDVQEMENTSLVVYDSTGATFRGIYSVKEDGTITDYNYPPTDESSFIAYTSCKPKIVTTDDKIKIVVEQYLSNAQYNHKITFDLDLDNSLYSMDALNIGRRVEFYYGDKLYKSIITGYEWSLPKDEERHHSVKVTLGKVRTKLTSKLNLRKKK